MWAWKSSLAKVSGGCRNNTVSPQGPLLSVKEVVSSHLIRSAQSQDVSRRLIFQPRPTQTPCVPKAAVLCFSTHQTYQQGFSNIIASNACGGAPGVLASAQQLLHVLLRTGGMRQALVTLLLLLLSSHQVRS